MMKETPQQTLLLGGCCCTVNMDNSIGLCKLEPSGTDCCAVAHCSNNSRGQSLCTPCALYCMCGWVFWQSAHPVVSDPCT